MIFFTNVMHTMLGFFHQYVPIWGLNIIMLTVFVKLILFLPSRKQQATMAKMAAVNLALKPEFEKLAEKYKDDPLDAPAGEDRPADAERRQPAGHDGRLLS